MEAPKAVIPAPRPRDLVVVGASRGGVAALGTLLASLPRHFALPMVVVLHRLAHGSGDYTALLQQHCALRVVTVEHGAPLASGCVYVAPGDYHLLVERGSLALSIDPPVHYARPSIDVLFESAAEAYGDGVVALVLTAGGSDGVDGARSVKAAGGLVIVQDPTTAEDGTLPEAVIATGSAAVVLAIKQIALYLACLTAPPQGSEV